MGVDLAAAPSGYATNDATSSPWWLTGASLEATYPVTPRLDVGLSLSGLVTLHRESFSVHGLDPEKIYETDRVVGIAAVRVEARIFREISLCACRG